MTVLSTHFLIGKEWTNQWITIISSNREPAEWLAAEWLAMTSDTLLAQSAIDRLTQGAHTLVIERTSWRQRNAPSWRAAVEERRR